MNLYADFTSKKDFDYSKFCKMTDFIKNEVSNGLFHGEYLWINVERKNQDEAIESIKNSFIKYTHFAELKVVREEEGFWIKPYFQDTSSGGKYGYIDDMLTAKHAMFVNGVSLDFSKIKEFLPYEDYEVFFTNRELSNFLSFWLVDKNSEYILARKLVLENANKRDYKPVKEGSKIELIKLREVVKVTHEGFPHVEEDKLLKEIASQYLVQNV